MFFYVNDSNDSFKWMPRRDFCFLCDFLSAPILWPSQGSFFFSLLVNAWVFYHALHQYHCLLWGWVSSVPVRRDLPHRLTLQNRGVKWTLHERELCIFVTVEKRLSLAEVCSLYVRLGGVVEVFGAWWSDMYTGQQLQRESRAPHISQEL